MRLITATAIAVAVFGGVAAVGAGAQVAHSSHAKAQAKAHVVADDALPTLQLAQARLATAKYANSLDAAKADGYKILTREIPGMGYHFLNPNVSGFNVRKPPILVYEKHGSQWQLGALEWVFTSMPATPPLKGAQYGSFPAACHYADGTFIPEPAASDCPATAPDGAAFGFWHPDLVTMHVWLWYPNPDGIYASFNPLVSPFNDN